MDTILFYVFAVTTLGGALLTVTRRNPVHCAIALILAMLGIAGEFLLAGAEFLFAVQILLYIGGVMVLFLFVMMLMNLEQTIKLRAYSRQWPVAIAAVLSVAALLAFLLLRGARELPSPAAAPINSNGNTERVADVLFYQYALPFEAASLLLLVAIVGAVLMAKKKEPAVEP
jgi:NADH-quinone oxidoreductase subunit J